MIRDNQRLLLFTGEADVKRVIGPADPRFGVARRHRRLTGPVMLDLQPLTLLPDVVIEVVRTDGLVDVARDYCWVSHIEVSFRQNLQD
jgi:hypothetical protein